MLPNEDNMRAPQDEYQQHRGIELLVSFVLGLIVMLLVTRMYRYFHGEQEPAAQSNLSNDEESKKDVEEALAPKLPFDIPIAAPMGSWEKKPAAGPGLNPPPQSKPKSAKKLHTSEPLSWPHLSKPLGAMKKHYPVLIIGSGYGGGVAACRLSRAGQKVCVLERGKEMWPGQYPDTMLKAAEEMQIRTPALAGSVPVVGKRDGFLDFRFEEGSVVWVGCGLGGGSLVNSGVCIDPDRRVFDAPEWPKGIRADVAGPLQQGYDLAKEMLQPAQYPQAPGKPSPLARATRMEEAAAHLRDNGYPAAKNDLAYVNVSFASHTNPAGVEQPECTLCGDCNIGCNVGAKNTVLMNYLPDAEAHGAEIYCQVEVVSIEAVTDGAADTSWIVHCSSTDPQQPQEFDITTDLLILAAGTLGSTEILLRSRSERKASVSDAVGLHYGTDGDFFAIGYNGEQAFNALGYGAGPDADKRRAEEGGASGPCITSVLDMRDPAADVREGMIIEDMAVPSAFAELITMIFSTLSGVEGQPTKGASVQAALARQTASFQKGPWTKGAAMTNSVMWGCMGFDDQAGKMVLENDNLRIKWLGPCKQPDPAKTNAKLKTATEMPSMKGTYCANPFVPMGERATVHPFGGCCMSDTAETGGCDHKGRVFLSSSGTNAYDTLYVWDGSTVPTSLGVNPLWTISAIAERGVALLAKERGWTIDNSPAVSRPQRGVPNSLANSEDALAW